MLQVWKTVRLRRTAAGAEGNAASKLLLAEGSDMVLSAPWMTTHFAAMPKYHSRLFAASTSAWSRLRQLPPLLLVGAAKAAAAAAVRHSSASARIAAMRCSSPDASSCCCELTSRLDPAGALEAVHRNGSCNRSSWH